MKSVSIFFLLSSVVINVVIGAPLLLRKELIPVTDDLNQRSDVYHGTTDLELYSAARDVHSEWDDIDGYFRRSATFSVDGNSHDPNEYRDLAVRPRGDMVLHGRDGNAAKVQKAGDAISKTGDVLSKAAKAADAIPEVGEIVGTALQVVSYFMKILGGLLKGIAEAERESAAVSLRIFFCRYVR
ncbi:hypothetical protein GYMLUDRAFT_712130 [Collybiopsis luxurians FD-317 M1]|nr:hypothetical protein GYMLUDRAFT_712130 [Collybiopsis luxurians FD-317 M1]